MSVRKDEIHVATLRELAEAHVEIARLTKALDEREADMHMRIRAGYDKTVADAWRAEVAKRDAEIARLTAETQAHGLAANLLFGAAGLGALVAGALFLDVL